MSNERHRGWGSIAHPRQRRGRSKTGRFSVVGRAGRTRHRRLRSSKSVPQPLGTRGATRQTHGYLDTFRILGLSVFRIRIYAYLHSPVSSIQEPSADTGASRHSVSSMRIQAVSAIITQEILMYYVSYVLCIVLYVLFVLFLRVL